MTAKNIEIPLRDFPFFKIVGDILRTLPPNSPHLFQRSALMALQESSEAYLVAVFEDANLLAIKDRRATINVRDMQLAVSSQSPSLAG